MKGASTVSKSQVRGRGFLILAAVLALTLAALFHKSFLPGNIIYSNDAPLGLVASHQGDMPEGFTGTWHDLNFVGEEYIAGPPDFSLLWRTVLGAVGYSKFFCPMAMFFLGCCAWVFFKELRLAPIACILGGLAAGLNSDFFTTAAWGIIAQAVNFGANFLALAALANPNPRRAWIRYCLAGFAVGLGVMEGFDIGAIFSLFTAAFVVFQAWNTEDKTPAVLKLGQGALRTAVVALCAGIIATQAINSLVGTQIQGVAHTAQDPQTKAANWNNATSWSLPKTETLQVFMPGLFGDRQASWHMYGDMRHFHPSEYWGLIGVSPGLDEAIDEMLSPDEQKRTEGKQLRDYLQSHGVMFRLSGGCLYDGVLVVLVAFWAVFQSFRKQGSPYTLLQRRSIWFWLAMSIIALLLSWGRFAPFYQLFYALPYASTIRVPAKFMHVFSWAMVILFAYGVHGLSKLYLEVPLAAAKSASEHMKTWWAKASAFDKRWVRGCLIAVGLSAAACALYLLSLSNLENYLQVVGFSAAEAPQMAQHSAGAFGWFVGLLIVAVIIVTLVCAGWFAGRRAAWGGAILGAFLLLDLGIEDRPWIVYFDYLHKYESNPVVDLLSQKPYEHRVTSLNVNGNNLFNLLYESEWKQQLFPYYNIQTLDIIQEPRQSEEKQKFEAATRPAENSPPFRLWQLTNTRYILYVVPYAQMLGTNCHIVEKFDLKPRANESSPSLQDFTAVTNSDGPQAVMEFTDALPRAQLYSNWQIMASEDAALGLLSSPSFDPHRVVLVSGNIPAPPANASSDAGSVTINDNYRPKRVELEADVKAPSVLLLNDRYNEHWKVTVDGQPEKILRCNYIMRGVYLPEPGKHTIVFTFEPPIKGLYVSVAADAVAIGLLLFMVVVPGRKPEPGPVPQSVPVKPAETREQPKPQKKKKSGK